MTKNILQIGLLLFVCFFLSCTKFLDKKPDGKITTPSTMDDIEALLNDYTRLNGRCPSAGEISADNYYLTSPSWASSSEIHRDYYLWQKFDGINGDWNTGYVAIFYSNLILESLEKIPRETDREEQMALNFRGAAWFNRAYYNFTLAQLFAPPYDVATANKDLGLPLKKTTDINEKIQRSSVKQTYDLIISDLNHSLKYLPLKQPVKYHPTLAAAYGLLSRVYMSMQQYNKAGVYADSCLQIYDSLLDYSQMDTLSPIPFTRFNREVIYDVESASASALERSRARVDTNLYAEYSDNDLRKALFFIDNIDGTHTFKGNYTGENNAMMFTGIATDEMLLNRAESSARQGDKSNAVKDVNVLLSTRWKEGSYDAISLPIQGGLLKFILTERRKELLFRGLRWMDLRRLNKEPQLSDTLYRVINGHRYILMPNASNYVLQIPENTIKISDMPQNP